MLHVVSTTQSQQMSKSLELLDENMEHLSIKNAARLSENKIKVHLGSLTHYHSYHTVNMFFFLINAK